MDKKSSTCCFDYNQLFDLYKLYIAREEEIRTKWRSQMNVYITIMVSILTFSTLAARLLFDSNLSGICFIFGGFISFSIAIIAFFNFKIDFKYQMELLSIECKLEDLLGLTNKELFTFTKRWQNEALLPDYWYQKSGMNSVQFVKQMCKFKSINGCYTIYIVMALLSVAIVAVGFLLNQI